MASDRDQWADELSGESSSGWLTGFLADEDKFDRRSLWRLGWWGAGSMAAVVGALFVNHASVGWRREQMASADLMRQAQQIQWIAKESQNETRRLASAIDTLNSDRDRLYSRVTVLEQGLDSVTAGRSTGRARALPPHRQIPLRFGVLQFPIRECTANPTALRVHRFDALPAQPAANPSAAELIGPPKPAPVPSPTVAQAGAPTAASAPANVAQEWRTAGGND